MYSFFRAFGCVLLVFLSLGAQAQALRLELAQHGRMPCLAGYSIQLKATGGQPPYRFGRVEPGPSPGTRTIYEIITTGRIDSVQGNETFIVVDNNGTEAPLTLNLPTLPVFSYQFMIPELTLVDTMFCNLPPYRVVVDVTGGIPPYTANGQPFQPGDTLLFPSLNGIVTIIDSIGCSALRLIPNRPYYVRLNWIREPSNCYTQDGIIEVKDVGSGFYHYEMSVNNGPFQQLDTLYNLGNSNLFIRVRDNFNCDRYEVIRSRLIYGNVFLDAPTSCDSTNAIIRVQVDSGGRPPYQYALASTVGITPWQSSPVFSNLGPGIYTAHVRDSIGCVEIFNWDVKYVIGVGIKLSYQVVPAGCRESLGQILLSAQGGVPPYSFSIGNGFYQSSPNFSTVRPGIYNITVRDTIGCVGLNYKVVVPHLPFLDSVKVVQLRKCLDGEDGSIYAYATASPSQVLEYAVSDRMLSYDLAGFINVSRLKWQSSPLLTGLGKGPHFVYVRDSLDRACFSNYAYSPMDLHKGVTIPVDYDSLVTQAYPESCFGGNGAIWLFHPTPQIAARFRHKVSYLGSAMYLTAHPTNRPRPSQLIYDGPAIVHTGLQEGRYEVEVYDSLLKCVVAILNDSTPFNPTPNLTVRPALNKSFQFGLVNTPTNCGSGLGTAEFYPACQGCPPQAFRHRLNGGNWVSSAQIGPVRPGWNTLNVVLDDACTTRTQFHVPLDSAFLPNSVQTKPASYLTVPDGEATFTYGPILGSAVGPIQVFVGNTQVYQGPVATFRVSGLLPGAYLLRVVDAGGCQDSMPFQITWSLQSHTNQNGRVYWDRNNNQVYDMGDSAFAGVTVYAFDTITLKAKYYALTDSFGAYSLVAPRDFFSIRITRPPHHVAVHPPNSAWPSALWAGPSKTGVDFRIAALPNVTDMSVMLTSISYVRNTLNSTATTSQQLTLWNRGTVGAQFVTRVRQDSLLTFQFAGPLPLSVVSPSQLELAGSVGVGRSLTTMLRSTFEGFPFALNYLTSEAIVTASSGTDADRSNDTCIDRLYEVSGAGNKTSSAEPNPYPDMEAVLQNGAPATKVAPETRIHYIVRVRNETGKTVNRLVILDTLPAQLDLTRLRLEAQSLNGKLTLLPAGQLLYVVENANLPDAQANDLGSYAMLRFSVPADSIFRCALPIQNRAAVFLDDIQQLTPLTETELTSGKLPEEALLVPTDIRSNQPVRFTLSNPSGKRQYSLRIIGPETQPNTYIYLGYGPYEMRFTRAGRYWYEFVMNEGGCRYRRSGTFQVDALPSTANPKEFGFTLFPNPVSTGTALLRIEGSADSPWTVEVWSPAGNRAYTLQNQSAVSHIELPVVNLSSGLYLIRAYNAAGQRLNTRLSVVR